MADTVIGASLQVDTEQASQSVKSFKQQLKEAQEEVVILSEKFGATSKQATEAAKRAAELKDQIGDAKKLVDSFNPDEKFRGFSQALTGVAGGFTAITGAMGLLGIESQDVQKQLLKVQSALALSQGLNTIGDSIQSFKNLGATLVQTLGKSGLIGLAIAGVTALGLAIAGVFDNIGKLTDAEKEAADQLRINNELNKAAADSYGKAKVEVSNMLEKIQLAKEGLLKTKDVLKEYNEGLGKVIGSTNSLAKAEQNILDHGDDYIQLIFLKAKAEAAGALAVEASKKAIEDEGKAVNKSSDFFSSFFTSVNQRVEKHKKTLEEDNKNVENYLRKQDEILKQAAKFAKDKGLNSSALAGGSTGTGTVTPDPRIALEKQTAAELEKVRQENFLKSIADEKVRSEIQTIAEFENEKDRINKLKISEQLKTGLITELRNQRELKLAEIQKTYDDKKAADQKASDAKQAEIEKSALEKLTALRNENALSAIKDQQEQAKVRIEQSYQASIDEINALQATEGASADAIAKFEQTKTDLLVEAKIKRDAQIEELDKQTKEKQDALKLELDTAQQDSFTAQLTQLDAWYKEKLKIVQGNEELTLQLTEEYEKRKTAVVKSEGEQRLSIVANLLGSAADLVGKQTAAGKVLAIAQATINAWVGASEVLRAKSVLPEPFGTISKIANVAAIVATGLNAVKNIVKVQVPGGGGGSAPSIQSSPIAPLQPAAQATNTQLDQNAINNVGNAAVPVRAFVLEHDVSTNQDRITMLNRAARLGG